MDGVGGIPCQECEEGEEVGLHTLDIAGTPIQSARFGFEQLALHVQGNYFYILGREVFRCAAPQLVNTFKHTLILFA